MPPYQYERSANPYAGSIGDLLLRRGDIEAARAERVAAAQAQAAQQRGQAWGGAAQQIGQVVGGSINAYAQEKREAPIRAQESTVRQQQIDAGTAAATDRTRVSQERSAIDAALKDATVTNPDTGMMTYDRQKAQQLVVGASMGHLWPQISEILDASDAADTAMSKAHEAAILQSVKLVDAAGNDPAFFAHELQRGIANKRYTKEEAAPFFELAQRGPEDIAKVTASLLGKKPDLMPVNPGDAVIDKNNPNAGPVYTAPSKAEPPPKVDHEWVTRAGKAVQIEKGTAQPGDVPYQPPSQAQGPQPGWQWVTRTNSDGTQKEVYTNRVVDGDRPQNARVKATEDERKSAGFYGQMSDAIKVLDELEGGLGEQELYQIQTLPQEGLIGMANRGELSEAAKRYLRAFEQFTEARLRPVSGAAINDAEYARDRRTYAKQYAETPRLAEDRKVARNRALDSLKKRAGVALEDAETHGSGPKVGSTVTIKGKSMTVTAVYADGTFDAK